jgi:hypothetical protein
MRAFAEILGELPAADVPNRLELALLSVNLRDGIPAKRLPSNRYEVGEGFSYESRKYLR